VLLILQVTSPANMLVSPAGFEPATY